MRHEISTPRGAAIEEVQSIVYRSPESAGSAGGSNEKSGTPKPAPVADHVREVSIDPVVLFRYSAVTFNGHRIHYDAPYAIGPERYPGLVVHGPLQATYLLNFVATLASRPPTRFTFRGLAPAAGVESIVLNARNSSEHAIELWVADAQGRITMSGEAAW